MQIPSSRCSSTDYSCNQVYSSRQAVRFAAESRQGGQSTTRSQGRQNVQRSLDPEPSLYIKVLDKTVQAGGTVIIGGLLMIGGPAAHDAIHKQLDQTLIYETKLGYLTEAAPLPVQPPVSKETPKPSKDNDKDKVEDTTSQPQQPQFKFQRVDIPFGKFLAYGTDIVIGILTFLGIRKIPKKGNESQNDQSAQQTDNNNNRQANQQDYTGNNSQEDY